VEVEGGLPCRSCSTGVITGRVFKSVLNPPSSLKFIVVRIAVVAVIVIIIVFIRRRTIIIVLGFGSSRGGGLYVIRYGECRHEVEMSEERKGRKYSLIYLGREDPYLKVPK
jgi:hypothetical protein